VAVWAVAFATRIALVVIAGGTGATGSRKSLVAAPRPTSAPLSTCRRRVGPSHQREPTRQKLSTASSITVRSPASAALLTA
jgi:hypothetical protein